jgi:hypothetical protein
MCNVRHFFTLRIGRRHTFDRQGKQRVHTLVMSSVFPNSFYENNMASQLNNVSMLVEKPCPSTFVPLPFYSAAGWNAAVSFIRNNATDLVNERIDL